MNFTNLPRRGQTWRGNNSHRYIGFPRHSAALMIGGAGIKLTK